MHDPLNILVVIHLALSAVSALYAYTLEQHPGYAPDWTWATVVGGAVLILAALGAVSWAGFLPWQAVLIATTLCCAAGAPIIAWQRRQGRGRAAERERDKKPRRERP